jgi:large subunit ribosomal protein L6
VSRVGKKTIIIPKGVTVTIADGVLKAKGPKGELSVSVPEEISYNMEGSELSFTRSCDEKKVRSVHGLTRSLAFNVIEGVSTGWSKKLVIEGVGYKVEMKAKNLMLNMGYSHPIVVLPPTGVEFQTPNANTVIVAGINKYMVGQIAAVIRKLRPPEPYKGKGIRYEGEYVRRKAGKTAGK